MPDYKYKAQSKEGKILYGTMQAADENELHLELRKKECYLLNSKEITKRQRIHPLKSSVLASFSRQLGKLTGAGIPLVRALDIIAKEEGIPDREKELYTNVLRLVCQGIPLSDAMEEQAGAFPALYLNMIRSAEASGHLDKTALRMADHYDKETKLNGKLKSATTYPKVLAILLVLVIAIIMGYVVPKFGKVFSEMGALPAPTRILLNISHFIRHNWLFLLLGIGVLIIAWYIIGKIPSVRYQKDRLKIKMPILGRQFKVIYTARFARTLSSMYASGIPIVTALDIAKGTIGNSYIEGQFAGIIQMVRSGKNLSDALHQIDGFVTKLQSAVRVGEETGSLDTMLDSIADSLDFDSEMATGKMISYLEPVMIVILGVVVGVIIVAVIMPIYDSYSTIGGGAY